MTRTLKRSRDPNQLAKLIFDLATGEVEEEGPTLPDPNKDPAAVSLGRRGGLKGGAARSASLTPEQRLAIARAPAAKRWGRAT
jgi:hypothetical protein